jgi:NAD(P)-dependent dehydrogenase (short-subunit alcohol dehydrogenase family)
MGKLDKKIAVVTGAAMGNGEGIARVFAKHGARVLLWDVVDNVTDTARSIEDAGGKADSFMVDVTNYAQCVKAVNEAIAKYGHIDILCANAGVIRLGNFMDMTDEVRDFHFDVNIKGVWNSCKAVLPSMLQKDDGRIVVLSSVTGTMVADPGEVAYATTKAALWGFTKALAREYAEKNIRVNAICPGYIHTPMADQIATDSEPKDPDSVLDGIRRGVPIGRLGRIDEVGELVAFLASDESSYITGTTIVIDGGSTLPETVSVGI